MRKILLLILFSFALFSCDNREKKTMGKISLEIFVYNQPSKNIYDAVRIPISKMYFKDNNFIEVLPDFENRKQIPFAFITGDKYARFNNLEKINQITKFYDLAKKNFGVKFINDSIQNYTSKKILTDTSFNGYNYKRVAIATKKDYTVFYIHQTDTILPFSLSKQFDKDFHGILNRVDTYEIEKDRFTSLRMTISDTIPSNFFNALNNLK
ncbi:hypothetical protein [Flavobacterium daejeonense]|uniref:hypothetical protein n=1 Tax=Flavobacterium daejeonense TaxID=350893 RepID=UPI0012DCFDC4|nr:hypothetical protein [Flavobacterium daejeonense]